MRFLINCDPRQLPEVTKAIQESVAAGHAHCGYIVQNLTHPYLCISVRQTNAGWVAHAYDQTRESGE